MFHPDDMFSKIIEKRDPFNSKMVTEKEKFQSDEKIKK